MGMYDTVFAKCPKCNNELSWQSKAGDCILEGFDIQSVPLDIAISIEHKIETCNVCGTKVELKTNLTIPLRICMHTKIIED